MWKFVFAFGFVFVGNLAALVDDAPKRLTALDLAVQTHKWDGKAIQANAHCFYADTDEYRCAIGSAENVFVRIDLSNIQPDVMKKNIEDNCDTLAKMLNRACSVDITFTYQTNHPEENNSGRTTMLIEAQDGKGTLARVK